MVVVSGSVPKGRLIVMTDLKIFLWWIFVIFTLICILFCITAHFRYRNKKGIDQDHDFSSKYKYFGQPIYDQQHTLRGYELLLREFDPHQNKWQLPKDVVNFPLSKMVYTIRQIDPQITESIQVLALNMTVSQITDFRANYFFKWVLGVINKQQLSVELDAHDIRKANLLQQRRMLSVLKSLNHDHVKITIENVDSSKKTYQMLKKFLPFVDYFKFNIHSFKKSRNHWIDITLAQWQRLISKYHITSIVGKVEDQEQILLANQLNINLRQGYALGRPGKV